jgi:hypothetical protein
MFGDKYTLLLLISGAILIFLGLLGKFVFKKTGTSIAAIYTGILVFLGESVPYGLNYLKFKIGLVATVISYASIFVIASVLCASWANRDLRGEESALRFKHFIIALIISIVTVVILVGNAYISTSIGYPIILLDYIGLAFLIVGFIAVIPPLMIYYLFTAMGPFELRGRESFIESNPFLWIFCVLFYTVSIYLFLRHRQKRIKEGNKPVKGCISID